MNQDQNTANMEIPTIVYDRKKILYFLELRNLLSGEQSLIYSTGGIEKYSCGYVLQKLMVDEFILIRQESLKDFKENSAITYSDFSEWLWMCAEDIGDKEIASPEALVDLYLKTIRVSRPQKFPSWLNDYFAYLKFNSEQLMEGATFDFKYAYHSFEQLCFTYRSLSEVADQTQIKKDEQQ